MKVHSKNFDLIEKLSPVFHGFAFTKAPSMRSVPIKLGMALLAAFLVVACDGAEEREAAYFDRGKTLFEKGEIVKAELEFKNVLQINPKNTEARFYLSQIARNKGDLKGAFAQLLQLVSDNEKYLPAQVELGKLYMMAGRSSEALEKARFVLSLDSKHAEVRALLGAIELKAGKLDEAKSEAQTALTLENANKYAASVLATALYRQGHTDEAIQTIDRSLELNKGHIGLNALKVRFLVQSKNFTAAEAVYRQLITLQPDKVLPRIELANFLVHRNRLDDAERAITNAIAAFPDESKLKLYFIAFLQRNKTAERAQEQLTKFIAESPEEIQFRFALAQLHQSKKNPDEAKKIYLEIIDRDPKGPNGISAHLELARMATSQGNVTAADKYIAEVLALETENSAALLMRASRSVASRKYLEAVTDLRLVLRDEPNSTAALSLLAQAYIGAGQFQLAKETLLALVKVDSSDDLARVHLARLHARNREFDEATRVISEILARNPRYSAAIRTQIGLLIVKNELEKAEQISKQLIDSDGQKALGRELLARVYHAAGRYDDAAREFRSLLAVNPTSVFARIALASSYISDGKPQEARLSLEKYAGENPDDRLAHELLGQVLALQGDIIGAEREFQRSAEIGGDQSGAFGRLARYLVRQRLYSDAVRAFSKALQQTPEDRRLLFDLAVAHQLAGNMTSAINAYEKLLSVDPGIHAAANNLAALIADHRHDDKKALLRAIQLSKGFASSTNPYFLDTLGWVHYRLGNTNQAQEYLEQAKRLGGSFPSLHYHLGMVAFTNQLFGQAREQLTIALKSNADFDGVERARETLKKLDNLSP